MIGMGPMAKRILLIEDAPQVAGILVAKLAREGHEVAWKRNRAEALAALEQPFDLILLSTDLDARNAWEVLSELKAGTRTPIVMLLETEEASLDPEALRQGACGVILKPFKPTVVARKVREWLEAFPAAS